MTKKQIAVAGFTFGIIAVAIAFFLGCAIGKFHLQGHPTRIEPKYQIQSRSYLNLPRAEIDLHSQWDRDTVLLMTIADVVDGIEIEFYRGVQARVIAVHKSLADLNDWQRLYEYNQKELERIKVQR